MWAIMVNISTVRVDGRGKDWHGGYGLPMFYLDEYTSGFTTEAGAVHVAKEIVSHMRPADDLTDVQYHITATKL